MAGIGFELRKIYGRGTLLSNIWGSVYATMTVVGPSVLFAALILLLMFVMNLFGATELESKFFISSFTYIFLMAILVSAFFCTVVSRYISDCIFEKREKDISASVFGVLALGSVIASIYMLILCVMMYIQDDTPIEFLVLYYLLGILATNAYNIIIYVSALKNYRQVTLSYFFGLLVAVPMFFLAYFVWGLNIVIAAYSAMFVGFFIINFALLFLCIKAFGWPKSRFFTYLTYFKKYPKLLISGFAYMLGFYISTMIYWSLSDMRETISIFSTTPNYDLAMFLAIAVNMPALVIFVVKVETTFFEKYVTYLSVLSKGSFERIEKERESMSETIYQQLFFVYELQFIITIVAVFVINILFPYLSIGATTLNIFMPLAMGLYSVFCMYFTVIFLYYFEDHIGACIGPCVFVVITTVASLIMCFVETPIYPLPLLLGGILGWVVSYIYLKRRLKNLSAHLLCR